MGATRASTAATVAITATTSAMGRVQVRHNLGRAVLAWGATRTSISAMHQVRHIIGRQTSVHCRHIEEEGLI